MKPTKSARARLWWALPVALMTFALVVSSRSLLANREPLFEGKPFTFWLDQIPITQVMPNGGVSIRLPWTYKTMPEANASELSNKEKSDKALKAVDGIGGRCLPMLLRRLKSRDPALKTHLVQWLLMNHLLPRSMAPRSSDILRGQALTAIVNLGYSAKPIFPELTLLAHDSDPQIKAAATFALERLNPTEFSRLEQLQAGKK